MNSIKPKLDIGLFVCNECSVTRVVVLVVMLTGYLPEMQSKHLIKLIMMIGIVNFSSEFTAKFLNRLD